MGFGILFIGYFLLFPACFNFFYTLFPAVILLAYATRKLARVNIRFHQSFITLFPLFAVTLTAVILRQVLPVGHLLPDIADTAVLLLLLCFSFLLLTGIDWVSLEVGLTDLRARAVRNRLFLFLYYIPASALTLLPVFPVSENEQTAAMFAGLQAVFILMGFVLMVLNLWLIYSCYAQICMPDQLNRERKPSRFAFINRFRNRQDAREEEVLSYVKERRARRAEKERARAQKHTGRVARTAPRDDDFADADRETDTALPTDRNTEHKGDM